MSLVQMSISGAIMIIAIVIIRVLTIHRLPKKTFLILWAIVLLKLLIPVTITSPYSVFTVIYKYNFMNQDFVERQVIDYPTLLPVLPNPEVSFPMQINKKLSIYFIIWGIGFLFCSLYFTVSYIKSIRQFHESFPIGNEFIKNWIHQQNTARPIEIRQSSCIAAPLTYGIFKPVILIPKNIDWCNTKQLEYILTHELIHIRHFDTAKKLILTAALCIHWFNPFVYIMYILSNQDMELYCDEKVVHSFDNTTRAAYAHTLISMEEKKNSLTPFCNHFSKNTIEERITAIMKIKKLSLFTILTSILLVVGTASIFATSPAEAKSKSAYLSLTKNSNKIQVNVKTIKVGEHIKYGPYKLKAGTKITCDLSWNPIGGNLFLAVAKDFGRFNGLKTSGTDVALLKENIEIKKDGTYYIYIGRPNTIIFNSNISNLNADMKDITGTITISPK